VLFTAVRDTSRYRMISSFVLSAVVAVELHRRESKAVTTVGIPL
jgi:hypothetical protein